MDDIFVALDIDNITKREDIRSIWMDAGSRLFVSVGQGHRTHGLNAEVGRHRGREGKVESTLCSAECESVIHVLWECPAYGSCRVTFVACLKWSSTTLVSQYSCEVSTRYLGPFTV